MEKDNGQKMEELDNLITNECGIPLHKKRTNPCWYKLQDKAYNLGNHFENDTTDGELTIKVIVQAANDYISVDASKTWEHSSGYKQKMQMLRTFTDLDKAKTAIAKFCSKKFKN